MINKGKYKMLIVLVMVIFLMFGVAKQALALTANFNITSFKSTWCRHNGEVLGGPYDILLGQNNSLNARTVGASTGYINTYDSYRTLAEIGYSVSLPTGVKVTSAKLMIRARVEGDFDNYNYNTYTSFLGRSINNALLYNEWEEFDVTSFFNSYSGGGTAGIITDYYQHNCWYTGSGYGTWDQSSNLYFYYPSTYIPYLVITYEYAPSTPTINSPLPDTNHRDSIELTATSTVTSGTITYNWQYSLDGSTGWTNIGSSTSNFNWDIPEEIEEDAKIYLRCRATANGVYSGYSSIISFNNSYDPAIAARIAAEEAREAVNEIKDILERDVEPPVITRFSPIIDRVMVVRNNIEQFYVIARDNRTANNELQYRYKVGTGVYSEWADLETQAVSLILGTTNGHKQITLEVRDLAGNIALDTMGVFKL